MNEHIHEKYKIICRLTHADWTGTTFVITFVCNFRFNGEVGDVVVGRITEVSYFNCPSMMQDRIYIYIFLFLLLL